MGMIITGFNDLTQKLTWLQWIKELSTESMGGWGVAYEPLAWQTKSITTMPLPSPYQGFIIPARSPRAA